MSRLVLTSLFLSAALVASCASSGGAGRAEPRVRYEPLEEASPAPRALAHCESVELPTLPTRVVMPAAQDEAEAAVAEALQYYHQGDFETALALVRGAVASDPYAFRAHMTAGVVLSATKDHRSALVEFCLARRLDESSRKALYWIGYCYLEMGWVEQGIRAMRALTEVDPANARAWYELGYALVRQKDYEGALTALDRALEQRPQDAAAHYERGFSLYRLGRYAEAVVAYEAAARLRPTHGPTWRELAETAFVLGDWKVARRAALRASRVEPDAPEGAYWLGRTLVAQGRCRKGLKKLRKALRMAPEGERGRYEDALAEAEAACESE